VFQLAVATTSGYLDPAIVLQHSEYRFHLHPSNMTKACRIGPCAFFGGFSRIETRVVQLLY
jgi:hypothetical protein